MSIIKHNHSDKVMQMIVLLDNFESANIILEKNDDQTKQYGMFDIIMIMTYLLILKINWRVLK